MGALQSPAGENVCLSVRAEVKRHAEKCFLGCNRPLEGPSLSLSGCHSFGNAYLLRVYARPGLVEGTGSDPCSPGAYGPRTEMLIIT